MKTWTVIVRYWLSEAANPEVSNDAHENIDIEAVTPAEAVHKALDAVPNVQRANGLRIDCFPKEDA